ncbi:hypothetical protein COCC4DRAFT_25322 [Bipolaris maydis ATCC 48331]|nr:uncharacterized protein COCC4DRAFT_25322 [Bipolaris maydis ATCC 48331]ENI03145.1 hypothetical protein COCC4DRAFT_25322 [Bipolaris maydis ATCC 48331]KAJ5052528.1 hypothetical protein J3E74DRAFT_295621 [Bipolaris maydis]
MDIKENPRKRMLEPMSSPSRKRARTSPTKPSKPILSLDCTFAPQSCTPQRFVSAPQSRTPLSFSLDSSTTFTSSTYFERTSARFYQDPFSSQVYDRHKTYNHQPQSHAQPPSGPPVATYWPGFSGYQPAWTPTYREPYGCYNFEDMCQTSVSRSIYSAISNSNGNSGHFANAARTNGPMMIPEPSGDTRSAFTDALESCLLRVQERVLRLQETVLAEKGSIEEMLQLAALLRSQH